MTVRITFLVGSLEHGKDGVGDYTRLLAAECARRGTTCQVIALADSFASVIEKREEQTGSKIVRLPQQMPWSRRVAVAQRALGSFGSDVVSLQYVPYSFQRWGLPFSLVNALPRLSGQARLHVMFHETWTGPGTSWRQGIISAGQRWCALRAAKDSALVHTSNRYYRDTLAGHGIDARILPLFGSVPIAAGDASPWLLPALRVAGCDDVMANRPAWWLCVMFGTLHPNWPPEPFLNRLQAAASTVGKRAALISVGRIGSGARLWREMTDANRNRIPMLQLGVQTPENISEVFNAVDFGVATTPFNLLGKSATAAAMLEHGLPVVVNREDGPRVEHQSMAPEHPLVIRLDAQFEERLTRPGPTRAPRHGLDSIAAQLLADLADYASERVVATPAPPDGCPEVTFDVPAQPSNR